MLTVRETSDLRELAADRPLWDSLLARTPRASFFHTLAWLESYWRHFGQRQKLRLLSVWSGEELVGILPLAVRPEATRLGTIRVLAYPMDDWGSFFGPIGPHPTATLQAALAHLRHTPRDWDLLDLRHVDATSVEAESTPAAMTLAGFRPHRQTWSQVALVELEGSWEAYLAARPQKWRENLRRCQRRLAERGTVRHVRYRPTGGAAGQDDPRWDLFDQCVQLAQRSWQGSCPTGTTLCHASVEPFLRDCHAIAAARGNLDLNLLLVDERPVAFAYNYCQAGWVSGLRMGFDAEFAACGPGTVLQAMILEDSFRRGDRVFDLGAGSLACKESWRTTIVPSYRYTHFPLAAPRVGLLHLKRWFQARLQGPEHAQYEAGARKSAGGA